MTDAFREVDEEVRRDQLAQFWAKYNALIVGAAVLLVVAVGGWRFYEHQQLKAAEAAGAGLDAAIRQLRDPETADAGEKALAAISSGEAAGYRVIARFRLAAEQARTNPEAAASAFDAMANDAALDQTFRSLALIRAALLRVDTQPYAAFKPGVEPLAASGSVWRHTARELLGVSALKAGALDDAGRWFDQIVTDRETPQALKQRGDLYLALVRAGPVNPAK